MIDLIVLLIIIFFTLAGLRNGCWQYLLELLITAVSLGVAWSYYELGHEILKSLLLFVWIFLGLSLLKWFLLRARRKRTPQKPSLSFDSRLYGAILGFIWGTFIAVLLVLTIDLLPSETVFSDNIKQRVRASGACQIIQDLIPIKEVAIVENITYMSKVSLDEEAKMRLREQPEVQELLEHKYLNAIMEDPETLNQLQNKDFPRLLTNPKILRLLNDGQFIEKLMKLDFKKALEEEEE